jgi:hypothetical protein
MEHNLAVAVCRAAWKNYDRSRLSPPRNTNNRNAVNLWSTQPSVVAACCSVDLA